MTRHLGTCEICGTETVVTVDHDHRTGDIRGKLCRRCNSGLGFFRDSPERLRRAIEYLTAVELRTHAVPYRMAHLLPHMRTRAPRGDGSIRFRGDGRWEASFSVGKNKRRSFYGKSRREAEQKMLAARYETLSNDLLKTGS